MWDLIQLFFYAIYILLIILIVLRVRQRKNASSYNTTVVKIDGMTKEDILNQFNENNNTSYIIGHDISVQDNYIIIDGETIPIRFVSPINLNSLPRNIGAIKNERDIASIFAHMNHLNKDDIRIKEIWTIK